MSESSGGGYNHLWGLGVADQARNETSMLNLTLIGD